jgi:hypothetical protein
VRRQRLLDVPCCRLGSIGWRWKKPHELSRHRRRSEDANAELRGRLLPNQSLAELTWFRVGGPAQIVFMPEDEGDLGYFLANLPSEIPVTVIGLGSNLIVRDGGVPGVVIRLGRGFGEVAVEGLAFAPAPRCPTSRSRARRRKPASPDCRLCAAFPAASAVRCA